MHAHTLIVGGGIMGTSIAMHLAARLDPIDEPVLLLERRTLGAGSSGRSAAILRQHYAAPQLATMARDSLRTWTAFEASTGYSVGFQRCGVLVLAGPERPEALERLRSNVAMLTGLGVDTRLVEGAELRRLVPGIELPAGTQAAWEPGGGFVDARRSVDAFAAIARYRGATTRADSEVTGFDVADGCLRGVQTNEGPIACRRAVVAAGPWTRRLLAPLGVELPLTVVRPLQQLLGMPPPPPSARVPEPVELAPSEAALMDTALRSVAADVDQLPAAHPVLIDLTHEVGARCEPALARTRVAALDCASMPVLDDPDAMGETRDEAFAGWARASLGARLPTYREKSDEGQLAGWYTLTPDTQALIGELPGVRGLWIVTGFSGHGFKLAPSVGEGVARLLCGEPAGTFDEAFFDPRRFEGATTAPAAGRFGL